MRWVVLLVFISIETFAANCSDIRMDQKNAQGKPDILSMANVPVTDQNSFGICYAHAATQSFDAGRKAWQEAYGKEVDTDISSPFVLALEYMAAYDFAAHNGVIEKENRCKYPFEGHASHSALAQLQSGRACPESKVSSLLINDPSIIHSTHIKDLHYLLDRLFESERGWYKSNLKKSCLHQKVEEGSIGHSERLCLSPEVGTEELVTLIQEYLNVSEEEILQEAKSNSSPMTAIRKLIYKNCPYKDRMKFPSSLNAERNSYEYPGDYTNRIDRYLDKMEINKKHAPLPIQTSLCGRVFRNKQYAGVTNHLSQETKDDCGNHAVLIIGRRTNPKTNQCEYLIRNSWGTSCNAFDENSLECEEGTGQLWIPKQVLWKNIYAMGKVWF